MALAGKVIKMTGMYQHRTRLQKLNGQNFIGADGRYAQDCIPSGLNLEPADCRGVRKLSIKFAQISEDTRKQLRLNVLALLKKHRSSKLHRCVHGKICIGYDLEPPLC